MSEGGLGSFGKKGIMTLTNLYRDRGVEYNFCSVFNISRQQKGFFHSGSSENYLEK